MRIVLIGAGNVATHLGRALQEAGQEILQVYSRTEASATALARVLHTEGVTSFDRLVPDADVCVLSVKDDALREIIPQVTVRNPSAVYLHTAGSVPMDVFKGFAAHYGVLYPMQTFSKQREVCFREIPCFLEASDGVAHDTVRTLTSSVSEHVRFLDTEARKRLHLSAVFACNFANHCYQLAADLLAEAGLPFDTLLPLIDETASKVHQLSPAAAQTGPAVRYDRQVLARQRALLEGNPLTQTIYDVMSESIHKHTQDD